MREIGTSKTEEYGTEVVFYHHGNSQIIVKVENVIVAICSYVHVDTKHPIWQIALLFAASGILSTSVDATSGPSNADVLSNLAKHVCSFFDGYTPLGSQKLN